jgi:hypothetical protein
MVTGRCLCGGVQFEVRGELGDTHLCYCELCRRANGRAFSANVPIPLERINGSAGESSFGNSKHLRGLSAPFVPSAVRPSMAAQSVTRTISGCGSAPCRGRPRPRSQPMFGFVPNLPGSRLTTVFRSMRPALRADPNGPIRSAKAAITAQYEG